MTHWTEIGPCRLACGDCLEILPELEPGSIDAVVTDPPYGLKFMGQRWDCQIPGVDAWRIVAGVMRPGCHLLCFGGSRTYHRVVVNIEDAGLEIRDTVMWLYGSGFPKSLDVSKAIDKETMVDCTACEATGRHKNPNPTSWEDYWLDEPCPHCGGRGKVRGAERKRIGRKIAGDGTAVGRSDGNTKTHEGYQRPWRDKPIEDQATAWLTAPATPAAEQWQGWGTALKPAHEPICLARKAIEGTVAQNVQQHGTGGINVDACRIEHNEKIVRPATVTGVKTSAHMEWRPWMQERLDAGQPLKADFENVAGRWPANVIHDGSDEVMAEFPNSGNGTGHATVAKRERNKGWCNSSPGEGVNAIDNYGDSGSAARFFYCAKASKAERDAGLEGLDPKRSGYRPNETEEGYAGNALSAHQHGSVPRRNHHPTVKPVALLRYLCRLITPPGGVILDCYAGSGSTGIAAIREGFRCILIERDADYFDIACRRIEAAVMAAKVA